MSNRKPGPSLAISLVVMIGGLVAMVAGFVLMVSRVVDVVIDVPVLTVPGKTPVELSAGSHILYSFGSRLKAGDVTVVGPDGAKLVVGTPLTDSTLPRGDGRSFAGVARFSTPERGTYIITVADTVPLGTEVVLGETPEGLARSVLPSLTVIGLGGLAAVAGLIMLLVGTSRRKSSPQQPAFVAAPGPGWHPDPSNPAMQRYWDGQRWTEHVSPR